MKFDKYQGTGNDFVIIDDRAHVFPREKQVISKICDRKFGIGSDGLILIDNSSEADFEMVFYNPDGSMSFCGNGSRCAVAYAYDHNIVGRTCSFKAIDGIHSAELTENGVRISIRDVSEAQQFGNDLFLNTGSPHYLVFKDSLELPEFYSEARRIRYSDDFESINGTNVNFITPSENGIAVRTYERGVENETLSCGSGVTACALGAVLKGLAVQSPLQVNTLGGSLYVYFNRRGESFSEVYLEGKAEKVFTGEIFI